MKFADHSWQWKRAAGRTASANGIHDITTSGAVRSAELQSTRMIYRMMEEHAYHAFCGAAWLNAHP